MISPMLHHLKTLAMIGMGFGPSSVPAPSPYGTMDSTCIKSLEVTSSISNGVITVTVTPDVGVPCRSSSCAFSSKLSTVPVNYHHEDGRIMYLDTDGASITQIRHDPSITVDQSIDFAVVGYDGSKLIFAPDPKITVTTGTCGGGLR